MTAPRTKKQRAKSPYNVDRTVSEIRKMLNETLGDPTRDLSILGMIRMRLLDENDPEDWVNTIIEEANLSLDCSAIVCDEGYDEDRADARKYASSLFETLRRVFAR
jgi:hypothetical protein